MEEILASIRRIIADDDATKSAQHAPEAPKAAASAASTASAARPATPPPRLPPAPRIAPPEPSLAEAQFQAPAAAVDSASMGGGGLEDQSADILDLTESMEAPMPAPPAPIPAPSAMPGPAPQFRTIDGSSDVSFDDAPERRRSAKEYRRAGSAYLACDQRSGRFRFQHACANRAGAERPHARGLGARDVAADAENLARRQSAGHGRAPGADRDRARLARALG